MTAPSREHRRHRGAAFALLVVVSPGLVGCATDEWIAQVVAVDDECVYTVSFEGEDNGGARDPQCHEVEQEVETEEVLVVGDCVQVSVQHPSIVIEHVVECPEDTPLRTTTTRD